MSKLGDYFLPSSAPQRPNLAAVDAADDPPAREESSKPPTPPVEQASNSPKRDWWQLLEAKDCPLSPTQRHVAMVMAKVMDDRCLCFLSHQGVAERTGLGKSAVQRARKALVASGYFAVVGTTDGGRKIYGLAINRVVLRTTLEASQVPPWVSPRTTGVVPATTELPETEEAEEDLQSRQAVAALVEKSFDSAGDPPSTAGGLDTFTAPLTAEHAAALERLFARLTSEQTDVNTRTTFGKLAAELSPHELDQAGEDLAAAIANGDASGVPVRNRTKFAYRILERKCNQKARPEAA